MYNKIMKKITLTLLFATLAMTSQAQFKIYNLELTGDANAGENSITNLTSIAINDAKYFGALATEPVSATEGSMYYNTTSNTTYTYDGSVWAAQGGDVRGPVSNTADGNLPLFDGTGGKTLKDSTIGIGTLVRNDSNQTITGDVSLVNGTFNAGATIGGSFVANYTSGDFHYSEIGASGSYGYVRLAGSFTEEIFIKSFAGSNRVETTGVPLHLVGDVQLDEVDISGDISSVDNITAGQTVSANEVDVTGNTVDISPTGESARLVIYSGDAGGNLITPINTGADVLKLDGDFVPKTASNYDLGSASLPWSTVHSDSFIGDGSLLTGISSIAATRKVSTTTDSPTTADEFLFVDDDAAGADVLLNLPTVVGNAGLVYNIKKLGTTGNVTIDPFGTEDIDNALSATLTSQYESISIVCDGAEWFIY